MAILHTRSITTFTHGLRHYLVSLSDILIFNLSKIPVLRTQRWLSRTARFQILARKTDNPLRRVIFCPVGRCLFGKSPFRMMTWREEKTHTDPSHKKCQDSGIGGARGNQSGKSAGSAEVRAALKFAQTISRPFTSTFSLSPQGTTSPPASLSPSTTTHLPFLKPPEGVYHKGMPCYGW